jgi:hypothetical protein
LSQLARAGMKAAEGEPCWRCRFSLIRVSTKLSPGRLF